VLEQNVPNPLNPTTMIAFMLDAASPSRLAVYDVQGRLVRTLVDAALPAGRHEVAWDGRDETGARVASGLYLYRLEAGVFRATRRMIVLK
jgi:flagellar hook assembly protein FlgD